MNEVEISVIVPIHNEESKLNKCLDSVFNQSFKSYEIILILDSSSVLSLNIVNEYKNKYSDKTCKIYEVSYLDPGETRNFGLSKASGRYIYFVDGDDYINYDTLQNLYLKAITFDVDLLISNYFVELEVSKKKKSSLMYKLQLEGLVSKTKILKRVIKDLYLRGYIWNKLFKKEIIDKYNIKFPSNKIAIEDRPFLINFILHSNNIYINKTKTYTYVQHVSSYVKSTSKLDFMQKYINSDFLVKVLLMKEHLFNKLDYKKLLTYRKNSLINDAKRLEKIMDYKNHPIVKLVDKELNLLYSKKLYVYNAPFSETLSYFDDISDLHPLKTKRGIIKSLKDLK